MEGNTSLVTHHLKFLAPSNFDLNINEYIPLSFKKIQ